MFVIIIRVAVLHYPQMVADGDAGSHYQKTAREILAGGAAHGIDRLPRDKHGNDGGFARAGGEF
jgi:hypothetical protein